MEGIRRLSAKGVGFALLLCLLIFFQATCAPQATFLNQKNANLPPRPRMGSYASSTVGTTFLGPNELGPHGYEYNWSEQNGIVYTCRGGHIDISHTRKAADWTAFLAARAFDRISRNKRSFTFKMREPSVYRIELTYPENWRELPQAEQERIAREIALALGPYLSYAANTWHEILTWFGYGNIAIYSEFPSAFSWEDTFSNLLGTHVAAEALRDTEHTYDKAVTLALDRELKNLGVQKASAARRASEKMRGLWFSGDWLFFVHTKSRNFDIGLDDGLVTPRLVPPIPECRGAEPQPYPVPNLDVLSEHGFSIKFEIEPKEWEKDKILSVIYPNAKEREKRLEPAVHFAPIMDYIRKAAAKKYPYNGDPQDPTPRTTFDFLEHVLPQTSTATPK